MQNLRRLLLWGPSQCWVSQNYLFCAHLRPMSTQKKCPIATNLLTGCDFGNITIHRHVSDSAPWSHHTAPQSRLCTDSTPTIQQSSLVISRSTVRSTRLFMAGPLTDMPSNDYQLLRLSGGGSDPVVGQWVWLVCNYDIVPWFVNEVYKRRLALVYGNGLSVKVVS